MAARLLQPEHLDAILRRFSKRTATALRSADTLGGQITGLRRLILAVLIEQGKPLGAYELIDELGRLIGRSVKPTSIYRSIEDLIAGRLIARIASRNLFVACAHPGHPHDCVLLICERCGTTRELEDQRLDKLIREDAHKVGFEPNHRILEIEGTCGDCRTG